MTVADLLPQDRREFGILAAGIALAFGLSTIPGLTIEPQELTDCRTELAIKSASLAACHLDVEDRTDRIGKCWERCRSMNTTGRTEAPEPTGGE